MAELKPNAETYRIRALAFLVAKDLGKARLAIRKAVELEPRWESIRFTSATIDYFSALSPAALPDRIIPWPEPVNLALVKGDDESLTCLRKAEDVFSQLAEGSSKKSEKRQNLEAWRLACLANDLEVQEQAIEYCKEILRTDPTHYRAITWALTRNFEINLKKSIEALNKLIGRNMVEIPHILALLGCYLVSGKAKSALKLLKDKRKIFVKQKAGVLWTFWQAQSLVVSGKPKAALTVIDSSGAGPELRPVRTMALRAFAKDTGDSDQLIHHLEGSYKETGDPIFLLECCDLMARQQNWSYVADRAKSLVKELATGEALKLAAIAAYNAKRFDLCLQLLDDHTDFFKQCKLPNELRRIRALSQQALGMLPEAISEREALIREEPTTENLLALAFLYFEKGDLKGLAIISRQLVDKADLSAEHSLQIARLIHWEDLELATSLWRKAVSQDLPDSLVGEVITLGYQLGLDKELRPLIARMSELGNKGRGGIQMATIEDLKLMVKKQHEEGIKLDEIYRDGSVPIQLIAERLRLPLAALYHGRLRRNESAPDPRKQFFLLARHGGRTLMQKFPDSVPKWNLNLDVTAFLLAAHIDILDLVEKVFKPLRIPADLIPALIAMRDRVTSHQPARLRALQKVIDLADRGSLVAVRSDLPSDYENSRLGEEMDDDWVALFENVRAEGGYLVDFLPLRKKDLSGSPSALPKDADNYLVNCRAVVEALWREGPLSAEEYSAALNALGNEGKEDPSGAVPREGSALFCRGNIPEVLADANLLHIVCDRFKVRIQISELDRARAELKEHDERRTLSDWTSRLIDRIRKGIDSGAYEIIPSLIEEEIKLDKSPPEGPEYKCLMALLRFEAQEGDVIWTDDRSLNSYLRRDTVPIIGINEILKSLVSANALDIIGYYSKISRLRASNVRFIPVQKDEILHYLGQAKVENNSVVETGELIILRRYVAACLLNRNVLQHPPMPEGAPNKNGEIAFVVGLGRAIMDALVELWAETDNENICEARAEWILSNLYIDHLGLFNTAGLRRSEHDERYLAALTLGALISEAISLKLTSVDNEPASRRKFFHWLFSRILKKRFEADPLLVVSVANILKKTVLSSSDEMFKEGPKGVVIRVLQLFYKDLPEVLRRELGRDSDFMSSIGMKFMTAITIGNWDFEPEEFWKAASEAINGRESKIRPIESDVEMTFQCVEDPDRGSAFSIIHPVTGKSNVVKKAELQLLLESPAERESVLRRNRHWFDCPSETFDKVVAEIASMEDPWRRMEATELWQKSSASLFYMKLHRQLREHNQFQFIDLFPPSLEGLLRHLRLKSDTKPGLDCHEALDTSAQKLIIEEGIIEAIDRLSGLPVPLPKSLIHAITNLSSEEKRSLIKKLLRNIGSPLSQIHLIKILMVMSDEIPAIRRLIRRMVRNLLSTKESEKFEAFSAILKWTNDEVGYFPEVRGWAPQIRLAVVWMHAHRLFSFFESGGASIKWLQETFSNAAQRIPPDILSRDTDYWVDIAHPRQVNRTTFLVSGLSYSLCEKWTGLVNAQLLALATTELFPELEGKRGFALPLLRDARQSRNSLNAFLGADYGETLSFFLGMDTLGNLSRSSLRTLVKNAVDKLSTEKEDFLSWALLHAVLGDLPPYEDMVDRLKQMFYQTDFTSLFEKDIHCGALAIQVASLQAINLGSEDLRHHLKDQIIKIAKFLANRRSTDLDIGAGREKALTSPIESGLFLVEPALNVALSAQSSQDSIAEFVALLTQMIEVWPPIISLLKPIIQRLCEELPISQAGQFWPLLVRLRAE